MRENERKVWFVAQQRRHSSLLRVLPYGGVFSLVLLKATCEKWEKMSLKLTLRENGKLSFSLVKIREKSLLSQDQKSFSLRTIPPAQSPAQFREFLSYRQGFLRVIIVFSVYLSQCWAIFQVFDIRMYKLCQISDLLVSEDFHFPHAYSLRFFDEPLYGREESIFLITFLIFRTTKAKNCRLQWETENLLLIKRNETISCFLLWGQCSIKHFICLSTDSNKCTEKANKRKMFRQQTTMTVNG